MLGNYSVQVSTGPATEPLATSDAKLHLRVDNSTEDTKIAGLIISARKLAEEFTGRRFITQEIKLRTDRFPVGADPLLLPGSPVRSLTALSYVNSTGGSGSLVSSDVNLDIYSEPARLEPIWGTSWPVTRSQQNAVTVTYSAGYGAASSDVPGPIKDAMLMWIHDMYWDRGDQISGTNTAKLPLTAERLLQPYVVGDEFHCYGPARETY